MVWIVSLGKISQIDTFHDDGSVGFVTIRPFPKQIPDPAHDITIIYGASPRLDLAFDVSVDFFFADVTVKESQAIDLPHASRTGEGFHEEIRRDPFFGGLLEHSRLHFA